VQPHPRLDPADAAERDRDLVDDVVTETFAERLERLLEPWDHPALAQRQVVGGVAEREPEHDPLQVLGLLDAVDDSGGDRGDAVHGIGRRRLGEHGATSRLGERRRQQLRLGREVAVGGGARDPGRLGGLLDAGSVAAFHQLPGGGEQLVAGAPLLLCAPGGHVVP
jgi:hypothetical protein